MTHNLHHLILHQWKNMFSHKPWCINSREDMMMKKNQKGKLVVLYGIEVSTQYVIYEGMVETY